ncbi:hypothetical protein CBR_g20110 [Chara braunii]|uniref:F-box domain-containing protein n=1 Tax=Chara braunii TaxID=69332 RepID=A0A388KZJ9_CHABU|nr:hypothetical protein CBR_g20110 [Chara braunii]|eukprot:GBG75479.1 hypothetical protein CBR_g20110 [Chara braunii]
MAQETGADEQEAMAAMFTGVVTDSEEKEAMALSTCAVIDKEDLRTGDSNDQSRSEASTKDQRTAEESGTHITDLPEAVLCEVLSWLGTAADICRTATVCSSFASAVRSNLTWERLMPRGCRRLCQLNPSSSSSSSSSPSSPSSSPADPSRPSHDAINRPEENLQNCYRRLVRGFVDRRCDHIHYRLVESTAALRMSVSVLGMEVVWGSNPDYWSRIPIKGSVFTEGMQLLNVCWFEISGSITCTLPRGRYTCAWRLSREEGGGFEFNRRAECSVSVEGGGKVERQVKTRRRDIALYPEWSELTVGSVQLPVAGENDQDAEVVSAVVRFRLLSMNPNWARGVFVDSLVIRSAGMQDGVGEGEEEEEEEEEEEQGEEEEDEQEEEEEEEEEEQGEEEEDEQEEDYSWSDRTRA